MRIAIIIQALNKQIERGRITSLLSISISICVCVYFPKIHKEHVHGANVIMCANDKLSKHILFKVFSYCSIIALCILVDDVFDVRARTWNKKLHRVSVVIVIIIQTKKSSNNSFILWCIETKSAAIHKK